MEYKQYPVPKELKQIVRYFWSYNASASSANKLVIKSFADKYPRLIFQDIDNFEPIISDGNKMPSCYLSGLDTKPTEAFWYESFSHFGVSFIQMLYIKFGELIRKILLIKRLIFLILKKLFCL